jgi:GMP synthase PP-ATPase subunit
MDYRSFIRDQIADIRKQVGITRRITAIPGVNRCLYDLTPKPRATVEYI